MPPAKNRLLFIFVCFVFIQSRLVVVAELVVVDVHEARLGDDRAVDSRIAAVFLSELSYGSAGMEKREFYGSSTGVLEPGKISSTQTKKNFKIT